jgi:hypothetical protein
MLPSMSAAPMLPCGLPKRRKTERKQHTPATCIEPLDER